MICCLCKKELSPRCNTKVVDNKTYCIPCYQDKIYPKRIKKLREEKHGKV